MKPLNDWQHVKTAPHKEDILILDCFYNNIHIASKADGWWETCCGNDDIYPTRWMPLPEAPENASYDEECEEDE